MAGKDRGGEQCCACTVIFNLLHTGRLVSQPSETTLSLAKCQCQYRHPGVLRGVDVEARESFEFCGCFASLVLTQAAVAANVTERQEPTGRTRCITTFDDCSNQLLYHDFIDTFVQTSFVNGAVDLISSSKMNKRQ